MDHSEKVKCLFQLVGLAIFSFQMYQALTKYFQYPKFEQKGSVDIANIKMPSVYVCPLDQYDIVANGQLGYPYPPSFTAGLQDKTSDACWDAYDSSLSFEDVLQRLYKVNLSNVEIQQFNSYDNYKNLDFEKTFFFPYGTCLKIKTMSLLEDVMLEIGNTKRSKVILEDPLKSNEFVIDEQPEAVTELGPTSSGLYEFKYYTVNQQINSYHINDGKTCKNYQSIGSSYAECLKEKLKAKLMNWYGCLPPWFPTEDQQCPTRIRNLFENITFASQVMFELTNKLMYSALLTECLPPCISTSYSMKMKREYSNFKEKARLTIEWNRKVVLMEEAYSFDIFGLIVELGSSLGLWLGLSAISLVDFGLFLHQRSVMKIK